MEEKLAFLKREEIRTMAKDLARLQEEEAINEKGKISRLRVEEKLKKETAEREKIASTMIPKSKELGIKDGPEEELLPKAKKPSALEKIIVRIIIVLLSLGFFLLITFGYWFLVIKKRPQPLPSPSASASISPSPSPEPSPSGLIIPSSLIPIAKTKLIEFDQTISLKQLIEETLENLGPESKDGEFIHLAIKEKENFLGFRSFAPKIGLAIPEDVLKNLAAEKPEDFTFFIQSADSRQRLGFLVRSLSQEETKENLKNWEAGMEKGLEILPLLSGKDKPAIASSFRQTAYQKVNFRCLTISKDDLGICYGVFNNYFVLTTSFEDMKKVIDIIKSQGLKKQVGQIFLIGFDGKTVTPELKKLFEKYKPGGVLLLSKNIESREQLKSLTSGLQDLSLKETGLPLLIAIDQEGGLISRIDFLEEKTAQSKIENSQKAYEIGLKRGKELKEVGVNLNLAPLLDMVQPSDFLFERSFQKPASQTGDYAKSIVLGQKEAGIITAIKHFPGYGNIAFNPEEKLATVTIFPETFQFKTALEANPELVMTAHIIYKEIDRSLPLSFSLAGIQSLKNTLGNQILIISDDLDQNSLLDKFSLEEVVTKPFLAGTDILIFSGYRLPAEQGLEAFLQAVDKGKVPQTKIQQAISRIVDLKKNLSK